MLYFKLTKTLDAVLSRKCFIMKKPYNRTKVKRAAAHTVATVQKEERIEQEKNEMRQKAIEASYDPMPFSAPIEQIYLTKNEINSLRF